MINRSHFQHKDTQATGHNREFRNRHTLTWLLIYNKSSRPVQWRNGLFNIYVVLDHLDRHIGKIVNFSPPIYKNINSLWIIKYKIIYFGRKSRLHSYVFVDRQRWINWLWCIYVKRYLTAMEKDELLLYVTT